jgi:8-oxo-dGTP diphosphatase
MKTLLVSAVALIDPDGRILLAQRPEGKSMAGLWEFPGGKVEPGETPEAALIRELAEELGINTWSSCLAPLTFASHSYDEFHLIMPLFACRKWEGIVTPLAFVPDACRLFVLEGVSIGFLENVDDSRASFDHCAVFDTSRNRITVASTVDLGFSANCKLDLAFYNRTPLCSMRVKGKLHIFQKGEKSDEASVRLHHGSLHDIFGERHVNAWKCFDKVRIRHEFSLGGLRAVRIKLKVEPPWGIQMSFETQELTWGHTRHTSSPIK